MMTRFLRRLLLVSATAAVLTACQATGQGLSADTTPPPAFAEVQPHVYLRYQLIGDGPNTVVLLHHHMASLEAWDEVIPYIASKNRTILRYDMRGAGLSAKVRHHVTMAEMTADLDALLARTGVKLPVVLVGDTLGATVLMQYAAEHPDKVAGVVALSPTAHKDPQPKSMEKYPDPLAPGAAIPTLAPGSDPTDPKAIHTGRVKQLNMAYPEELRTDPRRFSRFYGIFMSGDPMSSVLTMRMVYSVGFKDVLPRIKAPVLMAGGTLFVKPMAGYRELTALIPNAEFVELRTGHFASIQSPELVGPLVQSFLVKLGR